MSAARNGGCALCFEGGAASDPMDKRARVLEALAFEVIVRELDRLPVGRQARFVQAGPVGGAIARYAEGMLGWTVVEDHLTELNAAEASTRFDVCFVGCPMSQQTSRERALGHAADMLRRSGVVVFAIAEQEVADSLWSLLESAGVDSEQRFASARPDQANKVGAIVESLDGLGFTSCRITRERSLAVIVASREPVVVDDAGGVAPTAESLSEYYAQVAVDVNESLDLRLAMAVRHYVAVVNLGRDARAVESALFAWLKTACRFDLARPESVDLRLAEQLPAAGLLASAAFSAGMARVVHRFDWSGAVAYFELAEGLVKAWRRAGHPVDRTFDLISAAAPPHRLLSLLHLDTAAAMHGWEQLYMAETLDDRAHWTIRLYVEASSTGHGHLFDPYLDLVVDAVAAAGGVADQWNAMATVDGAYLLSRSALNRDDGWAATQWIAFAEEMLTRREDLVESAWREQTTKKLVTLRAEIGRARRRALSSIVPLPGPAHDALLWDASATPEVAGGVSVIIAYYRGEQYIRNALASVERQTVLPVEVIIVDDGSPEPFPDDVASTTYPFPLRRLVQGNAGQSAARNTGIRAARGEYVAFLDQDDEWAPHHLETMLAAIAEHATLSWVYSDFDVVDAEGVRVVGSYLRSKQILLDRPAIADLVASDIMALPSASIMRRRALTESRGFDRRLSGYEDDELFIRMRLAGWSQTAIPVTTIRYRVHGENSSGTVSFQRSRLIFLNLMTEQLGDHGQGWADIAALGERLLKATLSDYLRLLSTRNDKQAHIAAQVVRQIGQNAATEAHYSTWGLTLLERPRIMRVLLAVVGRLPRRIRQVLISEGLLRNYRRVQREAQTLRLRAGGD